MNQELLRYDQMVEHALRGVLTETLRQVQAHGLPGEHHLYITFKTTEPGVQLPDRLRGTYPGEMTIVLQFQFWDLLVDEECFEVTLSFNDMRERLRIPFHAVTAFADPSVNFGLQFQTEAELEESGGPEAGATAPAKPAPPPAEAEPEKAASAEDDEGANVVQLDVFRKK